MSGTLTEIRAALRAQLFELEEEGMKVRVAVGPTSLLKRETPLRVHVVLDGNDEPAQERLDELIGDGPGCVAELLEADRGLDGLVDDLMVVGCSGYKSYAAAVVNGDPGSTVLGAEWTVNCLI